MSPATILISDNERLVGELYLRIFQRTGARYEVRLVPDGMASETLAICRANPPDLLITDLRKRGLNGSSILSGVQLCRALRLDPRTREIPILVASALSGTIVDRKRTGLIADVDAFIAKPFSCDFVVNMARDLLAARELGVRFDRLTSLPPWQVLERGLLEFAHKHDWALLRITLDPIVHRFIFSRRVYAAIEHMRWSGDGAQSQFWIAHDRDPQRLLVAGSPATIMNIRDQLRAWFTGSWYRLFGPEPAPINWSVVTSMPQEAVFATLLLRDWFGGVLDQMPLRPPQLRLERVQGRACVLGSLDDLLGRIEPPVVIESV